MNASATQRIAPLAAARDGAVGYDELRRELGLGSSTIAKLARAGLLHPCFPRAYAFGHPTLGRRGWWWAALLSCGPASILVDRTAAAVRGELTATSTIHVGIPGRCGERVPGLDVRRYRLHPAERDAHRGLPVTSVARTALDLAATGTADRLGTMLDRALMEGHYDHAEMLALLDHRRGCRGVARLRAAVAVLADHPDAFRSRPEREARDDLIAAGVAAPQVNAWVPTRVGHGHELDLWWPDLGLDVEIDGPHHAYPHQRRKDERRDADLAGFGITVARFPTRAIQADPDAFVRAVVRLHAECRQRVRPGR